MYIRERGCFSQKKKRGFPFKFESKVSLLYVKTPHLPSKGKYNKTGIYIRRLFFYNFFFLFPLQEEGDPSSNIKERELPRKKRTVR